MASQSDLMARLVSYAQSQLPSFQPARDAKTWNFFQAFTMSGADTQAKLDAVNQQMLISQASGSYLTFLCQDRGVYRKPAVAASMPVQFSVPVANPGQSVALGVGTVLQLTPPPGQAPVQYLTQAVATIAAGATTSNTVTAQAATPAAAGNIASSVALTVLNQAYNAAAVTTAASGSTGYILGADAEADAALRNRTYQALQPQTVGAYVAGQAAQVPGIFAAVTIDGVAGVPDGAGNYTVYAADQAGDALSAPLTSAVTAAIAAVDGIGLTRHVASLTVLSQAVAANLYVDPTYSYANVSTAVAAAITTYVGALLPGAALRQFDLQRVLLGTMPGYNQIAGVLSFVLTTPAASVVPTATQMIRLSGSVTLTQVTS